MNAKRRKVIAQAADLIRQAATLLEIARDEEEEYLENMSETIRDGAKGERAQEVIDGLQDVVDTLEGIELEDVAQ